MRLKSPKYFISLYIKAKGFVEIDDQKILIQRKYSRHLIGLVKEEKKLERFYYLFSIIFSLVLSTSMFINRPENFSDLIILTLFLCICLIGMLFALFEVIKVYAAQKIIEEWDK